MSVRIEIEPVDYYCRACDSAMVETGCGAPGCAGYACLLCKEGCDLEWADQGHCVVAIEHMGYAQRLARQEERRLTHRHGRPVRTVSLP